MRPDQILNQGLLLEFLDLQLDLTLNLIETARITRHQGRSWMALRDARVALAMARHLATRVLPNGTPNQSGPRILELESALDALSTGPVVIPVKKLPARGKESRQSARRSSHTPSSRSRVR